VHLNLDSLEREDVRGLPAKKEPFAVVFGGKRFEFADAVEVNYLILATMNDTPNRFFRAALSEEDYKAFVKVAQPNPGQSKGGLDGIKLRGLMDSYRQHYGLDEGGNFVGS